MSPNYKKTKYSCFFAYLAMSSVFSLPPLLFVTFKEKFGISYTLLGTLVLVNFCTQLAVDLILTFFSKWFNIKKLIRIMPLMTSLGLTVYALVPTFFASHAYLGLLMGTVIFSVASGLCEVLLSPLVAALPSDNPERDMSTLHSLYAYGVVTVVIISSIFLKLFGKDNWMILTLIWAALPIVSFALFCASPIPDISITQNSGNRLSGAKKGLMLCVICIFLGSAAENAMTSWISGFIENALLLPKAVGDILGMASFAILLGLGRTFYAKYGKNISSVLLIGMIGATVCYIAVALSPNAFVSLISCVLVGLFTSMLWPGTLILMEENLPALGVTAYALMAAGGDLGGSLAPQLLGAVVDTVAQSNFALTLGERLSLTPDQIGMKVAMLCTAVFPLLGIIVLLCIKKHFQKKKV